jgi:hypothetical protein
MDTRLRPQRDFHDRRMRRRRIFNRLWPFGAAIAILLAGIVLGAIV